MNTSGWSLLIMCVLWSQTPAYGMEPDAEPAAATLKLTTLKIEPTIFFPKQNDASLKQLYRIHLSAEVAGYSQLRVVCTVDGENVAEAKAQISPAGVIELAVPEFEEPTTATFKMFDQNGALLVSEDIKTVPQRKFRLFCTSISHTDLGFIDYYQKLRRHVREEGIDRALEYCRLGEKLGYFPAVTSVSNSPGGNAE